MKTRQVKRDWATASERRCLDCNEPISRQNVTGRCRRCAGAFVGKSNAKPHPDCEICGAACPTTWQRFCSWECYLAGREIPTGANHHSWTGDDVGYWGARRRAQNAIPAAPCEACGTPNADRHHKDRNILNNALDNIAFLCRGCHSAEHAEEARERASRNWLVTSPDGVQKRIRNMSAFCQEHGLSDSAMNLVASGRRRSHKGWKCERIAEEVA